MGNINKCPLCGNKMKVSLTLETDDKGNVKPKLEYDATLRCDKCDEEDDIDVDI